MVPTNVVQTPYRERGRAVESMHVVKNIKVAYSVSTTEIMWACVVYDVKEFEFVGSSVQVMK
jgi:hypothetical protein